MEECGGGGGGGISHCKKRGRGQADSESTVILSSDAHSSVTGGAVPVLDMTPDGVISRTHTAASDTHTERERHLPMYTPSGDASPTKQAKSRVLVVAALRV